MDAEVTVSNQLVKDPEVPEPGKAGGRGEAGTKVGSDGTVEGAVSSDDSETGPVKAVVYN